MKKVVALFAVMGLVSLVGCGATNSCSGPISDPAPAANSSIQGCSLQAGGTATIQVQLCPSCADVSPSCQGEFVNGEFELATAFQTCEETRSCPLSSSCGLANNTVTCTVSNVPSAGSYAVQVIADHNGGFRPAGTIAVVASGGSTSCSL